MKIVIWGSYLDYQKYQRSLENEVYKGNMEIIGIILNEEKRYRMICGQKVIAVEELMTLNFDYIINLNSEEVNETIRKIIALMNISFDKVIPIRLFDVPYFDLKRWVEVKEKKVSIIANQCWGGFAYHMFNLKFHSPFINMWMKEADFLKMLTDLNGYLNETPVLLREERDPNTRFEYPVVGLKDIEMHWNHSVSYQEGLQTWNRRCERINKGNIFIHGIFYEKKSIDLFLELPFKNKFAITTVNCCEPNIFSIKGVELEHLKEKYNGDIGLYVNNMASMDGDDFKRLDILKMLNGEKDYMILNE